MTTKDPIIFPGPSVREMSEEYPDIPLRDQLWSLGRIAGYFSVSGSTVYRAIVCKPDFPAPIKIVGGPQRWIAGEVMDWADKQRRPVRKKNARSAA